MTVNRGGTLGVNYFFSYINLVMLAQECSISQAKDLTFQIFFRNDKERYGKETYTRFLEAYQLLIERKEPNR